MKQKALKAAFPYTLPIFAGFWFLALAYGILDECERLFLCLPHVHEYAYLRRLPGIHRCLHADVNLCAADHAHRDSLGSGKAPLLRHYHVGPLQRYGVEKALSHLRQCATKLFQSTIRRISRKMWTAAGLMLLL